MFTFNSHDNPIHLTPKTTISPVPDLTPPAKLFSLPPLHFAPEIAHPITDLTSAGHVAELRKYKQLLQAVEDKYKLQLSQMHDKISALYDEYLREKREHQMLKQRYREGEAIFIQLESQNQHLQRELTSLKTKKQEKNRNSLGKPKEIPVVKINVPNPRNIPSPDQALLRQLQSLRQELQIAKNKLEHQRKQALEARTTMRQLAKQNKELSDKNDQLRQIAQPQIQYRTVYATREEDQKAMQRVKDELEGLRRIHRSCDVLLASKQAQIQALQKELTLLKSIESPAKWNRRTGSNLNESKSSSKPHQTSAIDESRLQYLEQHLELSTKQLKSIDNLFKTLLQDYMAKIQELRNQVEWANKKWQHQQFELERVYELLRDKKAELENCYRDLMSAKKNHRNSPGDPEQNSDLNSLLKNRRDFSA